MLSEIPKKTSIVPVPTSLLSNSQNMNTVEYFSTSSNYESVHTQADILLHVNGATIEIRNSASSDLIGRVIQVLAYA